MSTGDEPEAREDVGGAPTLLASSSASRLDSNDPSTGVWPAGSSSRDSCCASLEMSEEDGVPARMSSPPPPDTCSLIAPSSGLSVATSCVSTTSSCLSTPCCLPTSFCLSTKVSFRTLTPSSPCCVSWSTPTWVLAPPSCIPWSTPTWEFAPPSCIPWSTPTWEFAPPSCVPWSTPTWEFAPPSCVPWSTPTWELASSSVAGCILSSGRVKVRCVIPLPLVIGMEHVELTLASSPNSSRVLVGVPLVRVWSATKKPLFPLGSTSVFSASFSERLLGVPSLSLPPPTSPNI